MEGFRGSGANDVNSSVRKKRSNTSRRPRNEPRTPLDNCNKSSPSDLSQGSSDDNDGHGPTIRKKEINVLCSSMASYSDDTKIAIENEDGGFVDSEGASNNGSFRGSNEQSRGGVEPRTRGKGVPAPVNGTIPAEAATFVSVLDDFDNENIVKKVKLKVGGVTRTIRTKSISDGASVVGSSSATKASRISDSPRPRQKLKQDLNEDRSFTSDEGNGLQGSPQMDSRSVANFRNNVNSVELNANANAHGIEKCDSVRKSRRVPKRRFIDEVLDDEDEDNEEYLGKIKTSRGIEFKERESRKPRKTLQRNSVAQHDIRTGEYGQSRSRREAKFRSGRVLDDIDYVEEEESISDDEPRRKKKRQKKEFVDSVVDHKNERTVTTRQRALQTGKDVASSLGAPLIEFPAGLPPAPPRKQKDKPSELERQLKKDEAAQRRRIQVEKAARESEAEAIRKILGQDSSRKKREDKIKKQREDHALERAANAMTLASDTVRWVMGPSGTTVIFPTEMGLPNIFDTKPCSYPAPREKCAGPSCTNPYKYRDSESKLPLCSLQCYKAIHEKMRPLICMLN